VDVDMETDRLERTWEEGIVGVAVHNISEDFVVIARPVDRTFCVGRAQRERGQKPGSSTGEYGMRSEGREVATSGRPP